MNNKQKINMTSSLMDDIYFYEWNNKYLHSDFVIIFVGGAFVTIQSYFDFLDHIANDISVKIVAIPLMHQDHSTFKMLDFSFEKQKKIIDKIITKVSNIHSKIIYIGIDIGASIGLYLNHDFYFYFLINPFSEWNPQIQNKLFQKISQIPLLFEFIKEYLIKFINFNIFFHVPQKFITNLLYQHNIQNSSDTASKCTTCKPPFGADKGELPVPSNVLLPQNSFTLNTFSIEFVSLNTFFELAVFQNIDEKIKHFHKKIYILFNENTITNIKHFYDIAKKNNVHHLLSVNDLQKLLHELFSKESKILVNPPQDNSTNNSFVRNNAVNHSFARNNSLNQNQNQNIPQPKNVSALPPFMTTQPPSNPLQPLLDLFQNNPAQVGVPSNLPGYYPNNSNPYNSNPMQNYLSGLANNNAYGNSIHHQMSKMGSGYPFPKPNPQQFNNANVSYNSGTLQ